MVNANGQGPRFSAPSKSPLRVGYVRKRYPRFSETFVVNEILAHERAGVDIDIFSLRGTTDTHFQDKLSQVRGAVTYLPEGNCRLSDFWSAVQQIRRCEPDVWSALARFEDAAPADVFQAVVLAQHVRKRRIQHLHAHFATSATSVARMAASMTGISYSFTAHAKDIFHEDVDPADLRTKIADASRVVTVSDYNLEYLREFCQEAADRVVRIYNGLELEEFQFCPPANRPPKILAVGRLVEKKGFEDLIEACAILESRAIPFNCEIIGEGEMAIALSRKINQLEIGHRLQLVGPMCRRDVMTAMRSSAVMAAPCIVGEDGNRDGLPTVLLEAMALGTPCISTGVTGIPELVRHEQTGLIVNQRSPSELANALARLLGNAELRVQLATAARALIEREYDIDCNASVQRGIFMDRRGTFCEVSQAAVGAH
jgi:colanic acid/amylovoran biosynthesis glycosyltransferase